MNKQKIKLLLFFLIGLLAAFLALLLLNKKEFEKNTSAVQPAASSQMLPRNFSQSNISTQTAAAKVITYVKVNKTLPSFYITKSAARKRGWAPSTGNLCDVLSGRAIGGDRFGNREGKLPAAEYFEADVNYSCGRRGTDRIVFSRQGKVYLTTDHYRTFVEQ